MPKIAVCITTRNRPENSDKIFFYHYKYLPEDAVLLVVDDASEYPADSDFRFEKQAGIPKAKNKCLELAYNSGAEHIFLFDDDTYPLPNNWYKPYIESKEPHLMYIFKGKGNQTKNIRETVRINNITAYNHTRGCMLYVTREVIESVGGFDTDYGLGMYEHTDWSDRIYNNNFTSYPYMDISGSNKLIHSMDEYSETESTFTYELRGHLLRRNKLLRLRKKGSKEFKEFRSKS